MPRNVIMRQVAIGAPTLAIVSALIYATIALGAGELLLLAAYGVASVIGFSAVSYIVGGFVVDMIESGQRNRKGVDG
jgi:hypothetical protein